MANKFASNFTVDENEIDISARRVKNKDGEVLEIIAGTGENHTVTGSESKKVTKSVTEVVGSTKNATIGGKATVSVGGYSLTSTAAGTETFKTNRTVEVTGNNKVTAGSEEVIIKGDATETVSGDKTVGVTGNENVTVGGDRQDTVDGSAIYNNHGYTNNVYGDCAVGVSGNSTETVNKNKTVDVLGDITVDGKTATVEVSGNYTESVGGDKGVTVQGNLTDTVVGSKADTVSKGYTFNSASANVTVDGVLSKNVGGENDTNSGNKTEIVNGLNTIGGSRLYVATDNPIKYSEPYYLNNKFNAVKMTSASGADYEVLVKGGKLLTSDLVINVLDYGVVGDGVTDDTQAIQSALNAVGDISVVWFPPKNYICNGVKVNSNTTILGYGASLKATTADNAMRNNADGATGGYSANQNISIRGLDFCSTNSYNCTLLTFGHSNNITIADCSFHDISGWHMIEINGSRDVLIENCKFYNYGSASATNCTEILQLDAMGESGWFPWFGPYDGTISQYVTIQNCTFDLTNSMPSNSMRKPCAIGNHSYVSWNARNINIINNIIRGRNGISAVSLNEAVIDGNQMIDVDNGVFINIQTRGLAVTNNVINGIFGADTDLNKRGVYITGSLYNELLNINISNNIIKNMRGHGIVPSGSNITVANNVIGGSGASGIYCGYDTLMLSVTGNIIYNSGTYDIYCNYHSFDGSKTTSVIANNVILTFGNTDSSSAMNVLVGGNEILTTFSKGSAVSYNNYKGTTLWS